MGIFWDKTISQLIEIIEWTEDGTETVVWRFPVRANEIKNGAKLIVREGQTAIFVNEGKIADVFKPGTYTLSTQNLPILATLKGWKYGFNSPFKAEVYFVAMTTFTDLKWGTQNPVMVRDPELGPVRLRAFGIFAVRVSDPAKFLRTIVGAESSFEIDEILGQLKRNLVSRFSGTLGKANITAIDLAKNFEHLSEHVLPVLSADFDELGLSLAKFLIENISLPPEVEKVLDKRSEMAIVGNVQEFAAYQAASAIPDAMQAPNSLAGAGAGLAAGLAVGGQMVGAMQNMFGTQTAAAAATALPPAATPGSTSAATNTVEGMVERLKKLEALKSQGVLTDDEYAKKRAEILSTL